MTLNEAINEQICPLLCYYVQYKAGTSTMIRKGETHEIKEISNKGKITVFKKGYKNYPIVTWDSLI